MKKITLIIALGAMLVASSGCGLLQAIFSYKPCVMRGTCEPSLCDEGCEEGYGPVYGGFPRRTACPPVVGPRRAVVCDDECGMPCRRPVLCPRCRQTLDTCWDPCGDRCYGRVWHRGPLSCLFALFVRPSWWGPSCGERYWGDFYSDLPDCWDPCDCYGNYTGGVGGCRECKRRSAGGIVEGYSSYGYPGRTIGNELPVPKERIISQSERVVSPAPQPTVQQQPRQAAKSKARQ